jgi:metallo-beta-lactamase class B
MNKKRYVPLLLALGLSMGSAAVSAQPTPSRVTPRNDLSVMAREPFKVFDNLYFVGIGEVASYVLTTSEGHILIDTLWDLPGYTEYLLGNIREMGLDPADIRYVLILQGHRDHYAGARALQDHIDAQFGAAAEDWRLIREDLGEWAPRADFVIEEGDTLTLGDTTIQFEITPGHTPGTTSMRFPVYDNGTRYNAYFHGGSDLRTEDPALIREFIADLERIKQIPDIQVQIVNHYDIAPSGAPDLFQRAALLAARQPGEPHPWVAPDDFKRWCDELAAAARQRLAEVEAR